MADFLPSIVSSLETPQDKFGVELAIEKDGKMIAFEDILELGPAVHFVEQVKVSIKIGQLLNIEVNLNPPLDQALALLRSGSLGLGFTTKRPSTATSIGSVSPLAAPVGGTSIFVNKIAVKLHYAGLESPWFKGMLLQPDIDITADGISITLKAVGMLFDASKTFPAKSFTGKETTESIIKTLIGDQVKIVYKSEAQSKFAQPYGKPINSTKNNLELAKDIIQEKNCFLIMSGSNDKDIQTVTISTVNEMRQVSSVNATFVAFRQIDPSKREFPLTAFSAPIQNLIVPGGPWGGFKVGTFDTSTKKAKITNSPKDTYAKERTGKVSSSDGSMGGDVSQAQNTASGDAGGISRNTQAGRMIPLPARNSSTSVIDLMKGFIHDATDNVFLYDITSIGVMDLLPGNLIQVAISDITELTGVFDCIEVEHVMGSGGVETRMSLVRTGGLVTAASLGIEKIKSKTANFLGTQTKTSTPTGVIPR